MPRSEDAQFKTVAVPVEVYDLLREIAKVDDRSIARELAYLIKEAHSQIVGGRS